MTEKLKDSLAMANGLTEARYIEKIRQNVEEEYPNKADEIANLRKEINILRSVIKYILLQTNLEFDFNDDEYIKYTTTVEDIKTKAKEDLEIK